MTKNIEAEKNEKIIDEILISKDCPFAQSIVRGAKFGRVIKSKDTHINGFSCYDNKYAAMLLIMKLNERDLSEYTQAIVYAYPSSPFAIKILGKSDNRGAWLLNLYKDNRIVYTITGSPDDWKTNFRSIEILSEMLECQVNDLFMTTKKK